MFDSDEKLIDILNWRRKQTRNLHWFATAVRVIAWMAAGFFLQHIPGELFHLGGSLTDVLTYLVEGAIVAVPLLGLAALMDAASELLSDSTLTQARMRQREDQRQRQTSNAQNIGQVPNL